MEWYQRPVRDKNRLEPDAIQRNTSEQCSDTTMMIVKAEIHHSEPNRIFYGCSTSVDVNCGTTVRAAAISTIVVSIPFQSVPVATAVRGDHCAEKSEDNIIIREQRSSRIFHSVSKPTNKASNWSYPHPRVAGVGANMRFSRRQPLSLPSNTCATLPHTSSIYQNLATACCRPIFHLLALVTSTSTAVVLSP